MVTSSELFRQLTTPAAPSVLPLNAQFEACRDPLVHILNRFETVALRSFFDPARR